jgi:hypothetical protein
MTSSKQQVKRYEKGQKDANSTNRICLDSVGFARTAATWTAKSKPAAIPSIQFRKF